LRRRPSAVKLVELGLGSGHSLLAGDSRVDVGGDAAAAAALEDVVAALSE
jgi:hypothetical protein